jgi:hypothetical protein
MTSKSHVIATHVPKFVEMCGICGVFGKDGAEALHVTDSAAQRLVRQMKTPEARHKAQTPHHTARMFTLLLKRVIFPRAKRPQTAPPPAPPPTPPIPPADAN